MSIFMKNNIESSAHNEKSQKIELLLGIVAAIVIVVLVAVVGLFIYNSQPKIVYQPTNACRLFTKEKAEELLGENMIASNAKDPVITGDTASSNCGYTDGNPNVDNMVVAAVIVRSGINDDGVEQNKREFIAGMPTDNIETVDDIGDQAYFNESLGQLNVLNGRDWLILSLGIGSAPEVNTVEDATRFANTVLQ